jgi:AraC family transcriptional regulator
MREPVFSDTLVYESALVRIGAFRCDRMYPGFRNTGPAQNDCFVFPRTAVQIEHQDAPPFVASLNVVTFYNRSQVYERREISDRGDRCDWFAVRRDLALEAVRAIGAEAEDAPFRWHRGRCDARTYLLQRRLFEAVTAGGFHDSIAIEEAVLLLLDRVIGGAMAVPGDVRRRGLVHDVERLLASRFDQHLDLTRVADQVDISPYHLCRVFREFTGFAVHQYLKQLRIRHGLESVLETADPLCRIAVDLGFTHHSHFTNGFRRDFEITPSALRSSRFRY